MKRNGYTLIELIVVISIVVVLLTLSLAAFGSTRKTARDGKRKADLEQIRSALELYRSDCKTYPATLGTSLVGSGVCAGTTYMSAVPTDPSTYSYTYNFLSANSYCLCARVENTTSASGTCTCSGTCGHASGCNYKVSNP